MKQCLTLSLQSPVSPTAFCVGSILTFPSPSRSSSQAPSILSTGFSREPPNPTSHAESSAISKFLALPLASVHKLILSSSPLLTEAEKEEIGRLTYEDVLKRADCYTTLEPCSVRTSGEPDCARLLARYGVKRVFVVRPVSVCLPRLSLFFSVLSSDGPWLIVGLWPSTLGRERAGRLCPVPRDETPRRGERRGLASGGSGEGMSGPCEEGEGLSERGSQEMSPR
jgi:pyrimidine deaminase RibD-like protein